MNYGLLYAALTALGFKRGGGSGPSPTLSPPVQITASRALTVADSGCVLYTVAGDNNAYAITTPAGLGNTFQPVTFVQLGNQPISSSPGVGVTQAITGSTAGIGTCMALLRADATAEIYELILPTVVPTKATTAQAQAGTNDATYMTPLKTAQAIAALGQAYAYTGLSTGLAAAIPSPTDGTTVNLTDTVWGGSGTTSGAGQVWIYIAAKSAWFPRSAIDIAAINSTAGVSGIANATQQFISPFQIPAICNHPSQRIQFYGIFGKSGVAGTLTFGFRIGSASGTGNQAIASLVLTATQIKGYFQGDVIFDSTTTYHEMGAYGLAPSTVALIATSIATAGSTLWFNPQLTPASTDTPIVYSLNIRLLPYSGV